MPGDCKFEVFSSCKCKKKKKRKEKIYFDQKVTFFDLQDIHFCLFWGDDNANT